jgi:hypothetical protein
MPKICSFLGELTKSMITDWLFGKALQRQGRECARYIRVSDPCRWYLTRRQGWGTLVPALIPTSVNHAPLERTYSVVCCGDGNPQLRFQDSPSIVRHCSVRVTE